MAVGDTGYSELIPMVGALAMIYAFHFGAQLLFKLKNGYKYAFIVKAVGPIGSFCLNYYRDGTN
jgi:hypothetical protein